MSRIALKGMQFHSFHGYYAEEQSVGNAYELDVLVDLKTMSANLNDDLSNTINYEEIYQICKRQMAIPQRLIETVGNLILADLRNELGTLVTYTVRIKKLSPLLGGLVDHALYEVHG